MTKFKRFNVAALAPALLLLAISTANSSEPISLSVLRSADEVALKNAFAEFDRAYVPALALTNFQKPAASHKAYAKLLPAFEKLKVDTGGAFPGDSQWQADLESVSTYLQEAGERLDAGELKAAHEALEKIRSTLMKARQRHNLEYYLDGMTRFHDTMESIVKPSVAALNKDEPLTDSRRAQLLKLIAQARQQWKDVDAQQLDLARFRFDEQRGQQLRAYIQKEYKALDRAEVAARGSDSKATLQAMVAVKAPFAQAFMLFGDFPGGKAPALGK